MYVARLKIRGFRGIKDGTIHLRPHTVLVGPNNVGKTAIVDALSLLLGRERLVRNLSEYDFTGATPEAHDRVHIKAVITGLSSEEVEDHDLFHLDGAVPIWWNSSSQELEVTPETGGTLAFEIGYCARFDVDELEEDAIRYFVDGDADPFLDGNIKKLNPRSIRDLGFFLLPARRTWELMMSFRSQLFRQVVALQQAMPGKAVRQLRDSLRAPVAQPEEEEPFAEVIRHINRELTAFLCVENTDLRFRPTPGDTPGVLEALHPHLVGRGGIHVPIGRHGSGVVSLQTLLLLLEFGRKRQESAANFILAAEEPELHLHPGHHRRLVGRMRSVSRQTIVTTHSPEVAAFHSLDEIISLQCDDEGVLRASPILSPGSEVPVANRFIRLFTLHRVDICEALMSNVIVLPEGITDFHWLRLLSKESITAEGWDDEALESASEPLGVLPTHDSSVVETFGLLSQSLSGILPLVDGDPAGSQYVRELTGACDFQPPPRVVQLAADRTIEDVMAWIILDSAADRDEVAAVLDGWDADHQSLAEALRSKQKYKQRWDKHEQLAGLVGACANRARRARLLLSGLSSIGLGRSPVNDCFHRDHHASTEATEVWRFDPWR